MINWKPRGEERTAELARSYARLNEDIVERKNLEEQLRHAQKMEAIGILTGGITHEFNNIMTAIITCATYLQEEMEKESSLKSFVDVIQISAQRAANLTQGLLSYSRKQESLLRLTSLHSIIRKVEVLLSKTIGEDIKLNICFTDNDVAVMVDSNQIEQVLMNLASNARDAMPYGGNLCINAGTIGIDSNFIRHHGYNSPGLYAIISVSDTGTGMAEDTREIIFEPFFTTKEFIKVPVWAYQWYTGLPGSMRAISMLRAK